MNINVFKEVFKKYKALISYLFFGICSMGVNTFSYYILAYRFRLSTAVGTFWAWLLATVFAYITNKQYVFDSKVWDKETVMKEAASFLFCRLLTGGLDVLIMVVGVEKLHLNGMGVKIISNFVVISLNYLASKVIIFRKQPQE